jgi:hypothetical protein
MATYLTTYSAGLAKYTMDAAGSHDPASETSGEWDPAADPDTGHPSSADKHIDERWPIDPPPPGYQGEVPPETAPEGLPPDPPIGQLALRSAEGTALEGERA